jgi:hypothetical protein
MSNKSNENEFDLLENNTAKVIFYSCLSEPRGIPEIARIWSYRTSTYFYQEKARELLDQMEKKKLIAIKRAEGTKLELITSNYELIFSKKDIDAFFAATQKQLVTDLVKYEYGDELTPEQLQDNMYIQFCLEKKPYLKKAAEPITFTQSEIEAFVSLWRTPLFRESFLSTDLLTHLRTIKEDARLFLPQNPRELLYSLTTTLCEDLYCPEEEVNLCWSLVPPSYYQPLNDDDLIQFLDSKLMGVKSRLMHRSEEFEIFKRSIQKVCKVVADKNRSVDRAFDGVTAPVTRHLENLRKILKIG